MTHTGLERLLRPKTIAVIGGGTWCVNVIEKCQQMGFAGTLYPVHPSKETLGGLKTYPSVNVLPEAPDASFIGVNRHTTIDIVRALRTKGAGGVVCFASGFSEAANEDAGGTDLQADLLDAAGDMTLIGPNCYGFINYLDGALLWPDQHGGVRTDRGVAVITQSSNIAINLTMQCRALPMAYMVTAGNQAQTDMARIGQALLKDDRVTALGLHIEGINDLTNFAALAKTARGLGKPVVVLKVGASDQAQAATLSHTASLAGSDAGARALFQRLGMAQVKSLPAFLETLKLLHICGPLRSNHISSISCSGGEASLIADTALNYDVVLPPLTDTQRTELRAALGPMVKLANPVDYHTYIWGDTAATAQTFSAMANADLGMTLLIMDFPRADRCDPAAWHHTIEAAAVARRASGRPFGIVASLPENMPEPLAQQIMEQGLVPFCGLDDALAAIQAGVFCGKGIVETVPVLPPIAARAPKLLTEHAAKAMLQTHGVRIPRSVTAESPEAAAEAFQTLRAPMVLKGQGVAHKSDAGAVVLNLETADAVARAARAMPAQSFLVEEMITGGVAELLIGAVRDPVHGYVLTLAAGGVLTELLTDSVSLLVPSTEAQISDVLHRLRVAKQLNGYRNQPAADISAIVKTVMAVQDFVTTHHGKIEEVEINPLICTPTTALAADALIRIEE